MKIAIGIVIAFTVSITAYIKQSLNLYASIFAFFLIIASLVFGGLYGFCLLLLVYGLIAFIDHIFKRKIDFAVSSINKKSGTRDFVQVFVNGFASFVAIILFYSTKNHAFIVAYTIGLAEAFADSAASDIGVLSDSPPFDICTFKKIDKGISGGISFLGTVASFIACLLCSCVYYIVFRSIKTSFFVLIIPFLGCVLDSILGSRLQAKFKCAVCGKNTEKLSHCDEKTLFVSGIRFIQNCTVNFISNTATVIVSILILSVR